jgi:CUB domain
MRAECGRTLQDSQGSFGSPGSITGLLDLTVTPVQQQQTNHQVELCQWRISATHGEKILLNLTMLDLPESSDCLINYVEIRDGPAATAPLLGSLMISQFTTAWKNSTMFAFKLIPLFQNFKFAKLFCKQVIICNLSQ